MIHAETKSIKPNVLPKWRKILISNSACRAHRHSRALTHPHSLMAGSQGQAHHGRHWARQPGTSLPPLPTHHPTRSTVILPLCLIPAPTLTLPCSLPAQVPPCPDRWLRPLAALDISLPRPLPDRRLQPAAFPLPPIDRSPQFSSSLYSFYRVIKTL
jgi:hypothetical protein